MATRFKQTCLIKSEVADDVKNSRALGGRAYGLKMLHMGRIAGADQNREREREEATLPPTPTGTRDYIPDSQFYKVEAPLSLVHLRKVQAANQKNTNHVEKTCKR
ncbi:hypothetical protein YC2023_074748 [Brassica napus]